MPKPRQIAETTVTAVVFRFLKKVLDTYTRTQVEGLPKVTKKASIKEGYAQGSSPGDLKKTNVDPIIADENNFKRIKERVKKILLEGKVQPTNETAAKQLLDIYIRNPEELRNMTELDSGFNEIFTGVFVDNLRDRQRVGIKRSGEQETPTKEEEQPQPEEAGVEEEEPRPVPTKEVKPKKVVPPLVQKKEKRDVPPLVQKKPSPMDSTDEDSENDEQYNKENVNKFFNRIKKDIKTEEGKKILQDSITGLNDINLSSGDMANAYILGQLRRLVSSEDYKMGDNIIAQYNDFLYKSNLSDNDISQNDLSIKLYGSSLEDKKAKQKPAPQVEEPKPTKQTTTETPKPTSEIVVPMIEQLKRNVSMPTGLGGGIGLQPQELEEIRKKQGKQKGKRLTKPKTTVAKDTARLEDVVSDVIDRKQIATKTNLTTGFGEMRQRLDDINVLLSSRPELKQIHADVIKQLERTGYDVKRGDVKLQGLGINKKIVDELIKTIPAENRDILAPAVRSIAGSGGVNMNDVVAGLVGLGVSLAGSPAIGAAVSPILRNMMNTYGVELNNYFDINDILPLPEQEQKQEQKQDAVAALAEEDPQVNGEVIDVLYDAADEHQPEATRESKITYVIDTLFSLPRAAIRKISDLRRTRKELKAAEILSAVGSDEEIKSIPLPQDERRTQVGESFVRGVGTGATYSALSAGLSTGSAQGGVSGIIPGGMAGGVAGTITEQALERYYIQQGIPMNPELRRKIKILATLPAAVAGAYIGYTPSGKVQDVVGQGTVSGAGITEKKITVEPEVLAQTKAQVDQEEPSKNKVWQPKSISPTTDILDESKQEKYVDDLEFIAFNYIPPTSEGAEGTVDTNPLKYQQLLESKIRYTNSGVYIPYLTWNKINDANNITDKRLKTMALGPELPPMKFESFDNDTTFENVAKWQYVNSEPLSVEFQSPYADFSNVENSWWTNGNNVLFTINP